MVRQLRPFSQKDPYGPGWIVVSDPAFVVSVCSRVNCPICEVLKVHLEKEEAKPSAPLAVGEGFAITA